MQSLREYKCVPCRGGVPTLTVEEIAELQPEVPEWQIIEVDGVKRLQRLFKLKNFAEAMAFTQQVGELAEAEDHHPAILTEWGKVTVTWWTHKIKGLHRNDFIMAAKTDAIVGSGSRPL
jgi:4a-hydroxytetrahydrobiopterin dehydratase